MKFQFEIGLIDDAKKFYKLYSIWFFALLGLAPDLYNLAVSYHMLDGATAPALLSRIINVVAFVGAAARLVQQKVTTEEAAGPVTEPSIAAAVSEAALGVAAAASGTPAPEPLATPAPAAVAADPAPMATVLNAVAEPTPSTPAPAPEPVAAPVVVAPVVPTTLAEQLSPTSTPTDVAAAVQEQVNTEFTLAQQADVVVRGRVMDRIIALTQEFTAKVEALKTAIEKAL